MVDADANHPSMPEAEVQMRQDDEVTSNVHAIDSMGANDKDKDGSITKPGEHAAVTVGTSSASSDEGRPCAYATDDAGADPDKVTDDKVIRDKVSLESDREPISIVQRPNEPDSVTGMTSTPIADHIQPPRDVKPLSHRTRQQERGEDNASIKPKRSRKPTNRYQPWIQTPHK